MHEQIPVRFLLIIVIVCNVDSSSLRRLQVDTPQTHCKTNTVSYLLLFNYYIMIREKILSGNKRTPRPKEQPWSANQDACIEY